jgi:S-adenosylmethionine-diacylglycerol 3-amino-3-carboxypropyl transferase
MAALVSSAKWPLDRTARADGSARPQVQYGQVWEDADVLLDALAVRPGDVCLSIASAGDNTLALLGRHPARVVAIDRSEAQLWCLELRVAAFRTLEHHEVLELFGSRPSASRTALYARCRRILSRPARAFWDSQPSAIARGIGGAGRFEQYFEAFRRWVLPLVHPPARIAALVRDKAPDERRRFYDEEWDSWRWRLLFRLFFSRTVMGRFGRSSECFSQVSGSVAGPLLARTRHALTTLNPAVNPYVHWILTGTHGDALPYALRSENFDVIRANLDRLEWKRSSLDEHLGTVADGTVDRCNLSDVFEYMPRGQYHRALRRLVEACRPGARLTYWNMLADRTRPEALSSSLRPVEPLASDLHDRDRAFFYGKLVVEEVLRCK